MAKVKLCGLKSLQDIEYVNELQPDYVGFVFAQGKRTVTKSQACEMRSKLKSQIPVVGVFVKEQMESIISLCREEIIQMVQLHGEEDLNYIKALREKISQPVIYAVRVRNRDDILRVKEYPVDYLLYDTYVKGVYGGTGQPMDCQMLPKIDRPIFLAGGLNPENVADAIRRVQPYCIDVSSGIETNGSKDYEKMKKLMKAVRKGSVNV